MGAIISWLVDIAKGIRDWFKALIHNVVYIATQLWGVVIIIIGLAWAAAHDMVGAFQGLFGLTNGMSMQHLDMLAHDSRVETLLAVANTFTPLDEFFAYLGAYLVVVGGFAVYRLIKSWVPGLSGAG